jgi:hypothetical protein
MGFTMYNELGRKLSIIFPLFPTFRHEAIGIYPQICREVFPMHPEKTNLSQEGRGMHVPFSGDSGF